MVCGHTEETVHCYPRFGNMIEICVAETWSQPGPGFFRVSAAASQPRHEPMDAPSMPASTRDLRPPQHQDPSTSCKRRHCETVYGADGSSSIRSAASVCCTVPIRAGSILTPAFITPCQRQKQKIYLNVSNPGPSRMRMVIFTPCTPRL